MKAITIILLINIAYLCHRFKHNKGDNLPQCGIWCKIKSYFSRNNVEYANNNKHTIKDKMMYKFINKSEKKIYKEIFMLMKKDDHPVSNMREHHHNGPRPRPHHHNHGPRPHHHGRPAPRHHHKCSKENKMLKNLNKYIFYHICQF